MASYASTHTMLSATPPLILLIAASTYRSCCAGTLAQRLEQLQNSLAPHMLAASEGAAGSRSSARCCRSIREAARERLQLLIGLEVGDEGVVGQVTVEGNSHRWA